MTEFKKFGDAVAKRYNEMVGRELYQVEVADIYESYLAAFPEGTNPVFRVRTEHDCNCCKNFIRRLGNVVAINDDLSIMTVWDDWATLPPPYGAVGARMQAIVQQAPITRVFRSKERQYGAERTPDNYENFMWDHFHGRVADRHYVNAPEEARGKIDARVHVFKRGLETLSPDAITTVIDLINTKSLYRGEEHLGNVLGFQALQYRYERALNRANFVWVNFDKVGASVRNSAIGTLLVDLSEGVDLEHAVKSFETKVAPMNYKRTTALITAKMVEGAVAKLNDLGLSDAVNRRVARLSDVSINDVIWAARAKQALMKDSITELLMPATTPRNITMAHATLVPVEYFVKEVLPGAEAMELLVQNRHLGNFVSVTGSNDPAPLFRWGNGFAWSYDGDVTDSIRERVKRAGGNVDAELRVSLSWHNSDDLDLHVNSPEGHVYFGNKSGILDVDMNAGGPTNAKDPVENMSWTRPKPGHYTFTVNQYTRRNTTNVGFDIELFANGKSDFFSYPKGLSNGQVQAVFSFDVDHERKVVNLSVASGMTSSTMAQNKWGVQTETLVPVDTLMLSPNHWGGNASGNKHWFFILRDCSNPEPTRGIYNEFLRPDLTEHRKVFEVLGAKTKCAPDPQGLAGLGFSSTRQDDCYVIVTHNGATRAYNIEF